MHSPESHCSLHGFAVQSPRCLRQFGENALRTHEDCSTTPRRLSCKLKIFEQVEKFLLVGESTANALRLIANALRLR